MADGGNHRIQVLTAERKFLEILGRCSQGRGEMELPIGVAIDTGDLLYVSEGGNHHHFRGSLCEAFWGGTRAT